MGFKQSINNKACDEHIFIIDLESFPHCCCAEFVFLVNYVEVDVGLKKPFDMVPSLHKLIGRVLGRIRLVELVPESGYVVKDGAENGDQQDREEKKRS